MSVFGIGNAVCGRGLCLDGFVRLGFCIRSVLGFRFLFGDIFEVKLRISGFLLILEAVWLIGPGILRVRLLFGIVLLVII